MNDNKPIQGPFLFKVTFSLKHDGLGVNTTDVKTTVADSGEQAVKKLKDSYPFGGATMFECVILSKVDQP